ncbi:MULTISPECIES: hypothetical protein [Vibrio]|uniref:hypothetical protein n=1 Tax=Vibrio TaxID=662 RepID=UPI00107F16B5|nr:MULTISPECIES: hypothetical protein [Vibrio]MCZ4307461.1 hypothetical protein [Vibrio atlanticus]
MLGYIAYYRIVDHIFPRQFLPVDVSVSFEQAYLDLFMAVAVNSVCAHNVIITDVNECRRDLAKKMGVTRAVNVMEE